MINAYVCDGVRTPIGRYSGSLSSIRTDDLAAKTISKLISRNANLDIAEIDEVILGCANQAGEDNRNVARMAGLLAGLPQEVPGTTINRLCGSGLDSVGFAARGIKSGDYELVIAGGVESMSRAPFVMPKAMSAFSRSNEIFDTTIGWRFVNPSFKSTFGTESMPETADEVANLYSIERDAQDEFALRSQKKWQSAQDAGVFTDEVMTVEIPQKKSKSLMFHTDEHPRPDITIEKLSALRGINGESHSVTAGNSSGVNDGSAALIVASEMAISRHLLTPKAKILSMAATGVEPKVMGIGPVSAARKALHKTGLQIEQMDVIELNEAFAAQSLAVLRELGIPDDAEHVNPNGGAIAMGHPLAMSGTRLVITASNHLQRTGGKYALVMMCVGVGQGVAMILERV